LLGNWLTGKFPSLRFQYQLSVGFFDRQYCAGKVSV
jgi:hypothetical protein